MQRIGIIGAGAWGTALAVIARRAGRDVVIWAHEPEVAGAINGGHENSMFLPGVYLDPAIRATGDARQALDADAVLLVPPAQFMRQICATLAPHYRPGLPLVVCTKGIEQETAHLMSEVVAQAIPGVTVAALSGPTFAIEVARDQPTAVTLAAAGLALATALSVALATAHFRIYQSSDLAGVQLGGAVKNVLAIGCGIVEGRGLGDNARAALITRGLAEMTRLALAMGGKTETMMGLAGLGDLTLTCNAMQSRNFSLGAALGGGESLDGILGARRSVAEGVWTARSVMTLAARLRLELPIAAAVNAILHQGADIDREIEGLLARPAGSEL